MNSAGHTTWPYYNMILCVHKTNLATVEHDRTCTRDSNRDIFSGGINKNCLQNLFLHSGTMLPSYRLLIRGNCGHAFAFDAPLEINLVSPKAR